MLILFIYLVIFQRDTKMPLYSICTACKHNLGTAAQKLNKTKQVGYEADNPDSPYLLTGRAFREKCIFTDYIMKEFLIFYLNYFVLK